MGSSTEGLDPVFAAKIQALIAASGGKVTVKSAFRSVERQSQLWNGALAKYGSAAAARKWVAPPGKSNHNKGNAVDLGGDLALAHKLAAGLGLSFPMGHEPWHIEPTGYRGDKEAHTTPPAGPAQSAASAGVTSATNTASSLPGPPSPRSVFSELGDLLMGGGDDGKTR